MEYKISIAKSDIPSAMLPFGYNGDVAYYHHPNNKNVLRKKVWSQNPHFRHFSTESFKDDDLIKFKDLIKVMKSITCDTIYLKIGNNNAGDFAYAYIYFVIY